MTTKAQETPTETRHPALIKEADLMEWLGYSRRGDLETFLVSHKMPFAYGRGGRIVTTIDAINQPLIGRQTEIQAGAIEFD